MVIALAGRRIDAPGASVRRFPPEHIGDVRQRLRAAFQTHRARALVCSAASGADLLALDVAGELGMRRRIVLPFVCRRFRQISVADRPGDWEALFDRICREVKAQRRSDVYVAPEKRPAHEAYAYANGRIIAQAMRIANQMTATARDGTPEQVLALIVWEGSPRGPDDLTAAFAQEARKRGLRTQEISTLF